MKSSRQGAMLCRHKYKSCLSWDMHNYTTVVVFTSKVGWRLILYLQRYYQLAGCLQNWYCNGLVLRLECKSDGMQRSWLDSCLETHTHARIETDYQPYNKQLGDLCSLHSLTSIIGILWRSGGGGASNSHFSDSLHSHGDSMSFVFAANIIHT